MDFEFTGRHMEITPAIEQLARKELGKLDKLLGSTPLRAHVTLTSEKHRKATEIVVYWRDSVFSAIGENTDAAQSVSSAAQRVVKQAMRLKEKFKTRKRAGARWRYRSRDACAAHHRGAALSRQAHDA